MIAAIMVAYTKHCYDNNRLDARQFLDRHLQLFGKPTAKYSTPPAVTTNAVPVSILRHKQYQPQWQPEQSKAITMPGRHSPLKELPQCLVTKIDLLQSLFAAEAQATVAIQSDFHRNSIATQSIPIPSALYVTLPPPELQQWGLQPVASGVFQYLRRIHLI